MIYFMFYMFRACLYLFLSLHGSFSCVSTKSKKVEFRDGCSNDMVVASRGSIACIAYAA